MLVIPALLGLKPVVMEKPTIEVIELLQKVLKKLKDP